MIRRVFGKEHSNSGKLADHGRSSCSNPGVWLTMVARTTVIATVVERGGQVLEMLVAVKLTECDK